jgi:hypothetical protein
MGEPNRASRPRRDFGATPEESEKSQLGQSGSPTANGHVQRVRGATPTEAAVPTGRPADLPSKQNCTLGPGRSQEDNLLAANPMGPPPRFKATP